MFGLGEVVAVAKQPVRYLSSRSKFFSLAPTGLSNAQWAELMDLLRVEQGWTDTQLGKQIGISISMIRQCRIQMRPLPPAAKVRILTAMGVEMTRSSLIAALPSAVKEAVVAAFFDGLATIAGVDLAGLAERLGLSLTELTCIREGRKPIPFLVKVSIIESYTAQDMGALILSLLPTA